VDDIPHVIDPGGTVANQIFQTPAVNCYYTISDLKTAITRKQLIDDNTAS
jgi:hypothetical protein